MPATKQLTLPKLRAALQAVVDSARAQAAFSLDEHAEYKDGMAKLFPAGNPAKCAEHARDVDSYLHVDRSFPSPEELGLDVFGQLR